MYEYDSHQAPVKGYHLTIPGRYNQEIGDHFSDAVISREPVKPPTWNLVCMLT